MKKRALPCTVALLLALTTVPAAATEDTTPSVLLWSDTVGLDPDSDCGKGLSFSVEFEHFEDCLLGDAMTLYAGDIGAFTFNAARAIDRDFGCFTAHLTNGLSEYMRTCVESKPNPHQDLYWCRWYREVEFVEGANDLAGYLIDEFRVTTHQLDCDPADRIRFTTEIWGQWDVGQPIAAIAPTTWWVSPGESFGLDVAINRAESATLEPGFGSIPPDGGVYQVQISEETTYVLTATNEVGTERREITLRPSMPRVIFNAQATTVYAGTSAELIWTTRAATDISIEPDVGGGLPASGTAHPVPTVENTTYTITACNALGCVEDSVTIDWKPPYVGVWAEPSHAYPGQPVNLKVRVAGADTATLEPGFGAIEPIHQDIPLTVEEPTTFVITATNAKGTSTAHGQLGFLAPGVGLTATPLRPSAGEPVQFDVSIEGATAAWLEPLEGEIPPTSGSFTASVTEPTTVVLRADNVIGSSETQVRVVPQPVLDFRVEPPFVRPGQEAVLIWDVLPFADVTIETLGPRRHEGRRILHPSRSMTFTLHAESDEVSQTATAHVFMGSAEEPSLEVHFTDEGLSPVGPQLEPQEPFDVYITAVRAEGGVAAFELSVRTSDCLMVVDTQILHDDPVNIALGEDNWIVGVPTCDFDPVSTPLLKYTLTGMSAECLERAQVQILPSIPSTFDPPSPGFLSCQIYPHLRVNTPFFVPPSPPFMTSSTALPVAAVTLRATSVRDGVRLAWNQLTPATEWLSLRRAAPGQPLQEVVRLHAEQALQISHWTDASAEVGASYTYLAVWRVDGTEIASDEVAVTVDAGPISTRLLSNAPNPFNPRTEIRYQLAATSEVALSIYNVGGRRVASHAVARQPRGTHSWTWNGTTDQGAEVGSGVYYVRLRTAAGVDTRRMVLLR